MTREEFIEVLDKEGYPYEIVGDKIVVTGGDNHGDVYLMSLKTLPPGIEFKNRGDVSLMSLKTLPPGVEFKNGWDVSLMSLKTIYPGVVFNNERIVFLKSLIGGRFSKWEGNIEGIDSKMLLNLMIKQGVFI